MSVQIQINFPIRINMSDFSYGNQPVHNVAQKGDVEQVIEYIDENSGNDLIKLNAYFDCLSQLYNMTKSGNLHRDNCISVIKSRIYNFSKHQKQKGVVLQSIKNSRIAENESLRETVKKVEYLIKQPYCDRNSWNCCWRNTRLSHHLSKIYGHPGSTNVTVGQSFFATVATGLIASGAALIVTNQTSYSFALGIPILCFGGAILAGSVISAVLAAKEDEP